MYRVPPFVHPCSSHLGLLCVPHLLRACPYLPRSNQSTRNNRPDLSAPQVRIEDVRLSVSLRVPFALAALLYISIRPWFLTRLDNPYLWALHFASVALFGLHPLQKLMSGIICCSIWAVHDYRYDTRTLLFCARNVVALLAFHRRHTCRHCHCNGNDMHGFQTRIKTPL